MGNPMGWDGMGQAWTAMEWDGMGQKNTSPEQAWGSKVCRQFGNLEEGLSPSYSAKSLKNSTKYMNAFKRALNLTIESKRGPKNLSNWIRSKVSKSLQFTLSNSSTNVRNVNQMVICSKKIQKLACGSALRPLFVTRIQMLALRSTPPHSWIRAY